MLLLSGLGFLTRFSLAVAALLSYLLLKPLISAYDPHTLGFIPITLLFLSVVPGSFGQWPMHKIFGSFQELSRQQLPRFYKDVLVLIPTIAFAQAAVSKMTGGVSNWFSGETIRTNLLYMYLNNDSQFVLSLMDYGVLLVLFSTAALFWQATFWLTFFFDRLRYPYLLFGLIFHTVILLVFDINFFFCFVFSYFIFPDWDQVVAKVKWGKQIPILGCSINT